ncbi:hypothetical protein [Streptomyces sp. CAU 1734]|uniref:hypothetical protein n=1 Tax=Streptomyces sp. CAU 1734 TaxID=3140360 RepID=UPI0032604BE5
MPFSLNPNAHVVVVTLKWAAEPVNCWTPGPGFIRSGRYWDRDNGDGTRTGVIAGFRPGPGHPPVPAWDGSRGPWADDEVWTITTPRAADLDDLLNSKPYRAIPLASVTDVLVTREPYSGHPAAAAAAYREEVAKSYGFSEQGITVDDCGYRVVLIYRPNLPSRTHPVSMARTLAGIAGELGARVSIRASADHTSSPYGLPELSGVEAGNAECVHL